MTVAILVLAGLAVLFIFQLVTRRGDMVANAAGAIIFGFIPLGLALRILSGTGNLPSVGAPSLGSSRGVLDRLTGLIPSSGPSMLGSGGLTGDLMGLLSEYWYIPVGAIVVLVLYRRFRK